MLALPGVAVAGQAAALTAAPQFSRQRSGRRGAAAAFSRVDDDLAGVGVEHEHGAAAAEVDVVESRGEMAWAYAEEQAADQLVGGFVVNCPQQHHAFLAGGVVVGAPVRPSEMVRRAPGELRHAIAEGGEDLGVDDPAVAVEQVFLVEEVERTVALEQRARQRQARGRALRLVVAGVIAQKALDPVRQHQNFAVRLQPGHLDPDVFRHQFDHFGRQRAAALANCGGRFGVADDA